jgi:hypothetical protein
MSGAPDAAELNVSGNDVQRTRAWTGLYVVVGGDIVIGFGAIVAVVRMANDSGRQAAMVSVLTSAFTAIATMTTAYFGIRSMSNTAQSSIAGAASGASSNPPPQPQTESLSGPEPDPSPSPTHASDPGSVDGTASGSAAALSEDANDTTGDSGGLGLQEAVEGIDMALAATKKAAQASQTAHEIAAEKQAQLKASVKKIHIRKK